MGGAADISSGAETSPPLFLTVPDPLARLARGEELRARVCGRGSEDPVSDVFCASKPPTVTGLAQLLSLLDLSLYDGVAGFAMTGHSSGVSRRSVSAINPRVVFARPQAPELSPLAVTFTRGETFVEIVTVDRVTGDLSFYLLSFALPCEERPGGCAPVDLLTSAVERDWLSIDLYQEVDLANTAVDCRICHQPDGPGTPKVLRMQEIGRPWTHWFSEQSEGGRALLADFFAAHGDDDFATIPHSTISTSHPGVVSAFVRIVGSRDEQPNEFPSIEVELEVESSAPEQPVDNSVPGSSATWERLYRAAQRAEAIPVPYHDVKVTDPAKLARMTEALRAHRNGELPPRALPDIRDVLPDDPIQRAEMGVLVDERLDDELLLSSACGLCHNGRLDPTLPRARFDIDLDKLDRAAKDVAIERLGLPGEHPLAMPPRRFHDLTEASRQRLIELLRK